MCECTKRANAQSFLRAQIHKARILLHWKYIMGFIYPQFFPIWTCITSVLPSITFCLLSNWYHDSIYRWIISDVIIFVQAYSWNTPMKLVCICKLFLELVFSIDVCSLTGIAPYQPQVLIILVFKNLHRRLIEYGVSKAVCFELSMPRALNGNLVFCLFHGGLWFKCSPYNVLFITLGLVLLLLCWLPSRQELVNGSSFRMAYPKFF